MWGKSGSRYLSSNPLLLTLVNPKNKHSPLTTLLSLKITKLLTKVADDFSRKRDGRTLLGRMYLGKRFSRYLIEKPLQCCLNSLLLIDNLINAPRNVNFHQCRSQDWLNQILLDIKYETLLESMSSVFFVNNHVWSKLYSLLVS